MGSFFCFRLNNTAVRRFHWWGSLGSWFCICFVTLVGWPTIYFYLLQVGFNFFIPLAGGKSIAMASGHSWSSIILSSPMLPPWYSLSPGGTNTCKQNKTGVTKSLFILSNFKNILWYLIRTKLRNSPSLKFIRTSSLACTNMHCWFYCFIFIKRYLKFQFWNDSHSLVILHVSIVQGISHPGISDLSVVINYWPGIPYLNQAVIFRITDGEIHPVLIHRLSDDVADIIGRGQKQCFVGSLWFNALSINLQGSSWKSNKNTMIKHKFW